MAFSRAWTALRDWTQGELVTPAMLNAQLRDNLAYLGPLAYVEFTADVSVTGTSFVDIVSSGAITYPATPILIEFYCTRVTAGASASVVLSLRDGATDLGRVSAVNATTSANPFYITRTLTPTAGSHTYTLSAKNLSAQTSTVFAGTGGVDTNMPGYVRIRGLVP